MNLSLSVTKLQNIGILAKELRFEPFPWSHSRFTNLPAKTRTELLGSFLLCETGGARGKAKWRSFSPLPHSVSKSSDALHLSQRPFPNASSARIFGDEHRRDQNRTEIRLSRVRPQLI